MTCPPRDDQPNLRFFQHFFIVDLKKEAARDAHQSNGRFPQSSLNPTYHARAKHGGGSTCRSVAAPATKTAVTLVWGDPCIATPRRTRHERAGCRGETGLGFRHRVGRGVFDPGPPVSVGIRSGLKDTAVPGW